MNRQVPTRTKPPTPGQMLDHDAEALAAQHQQRLHQMTREAVYGRRKKARKHIFGLRPVAVPALSLLAAALVWQLMPSSENPQPTPIAQNVAVPAEAVPAWVKDTDVQVAVIENIEFYQWLAKKLNNENHS